MGDTEYPSTTTRLFVGRDWWPYDRVWAVAACFLAGASMTHLAAALDVPQAVIEACTRMGTMRKARPLPPTAEPAPRPGPEPAPVTRKRRPR